jgi:glycosyltransferase involved in cell wall biosynthesis
MTADAVGGVWPYALDLSAGLTARGVEVTLAVLGPAPAPDQRTAAARAGVRLEHCPGRLEWMDEPWNDVDRAGAWLLDLASRVAPDIVHLNGYSHAALPWPAPAVVVAHSCVCSWWQAVLGTDAPASYGEYRRRVRRGLDAAAVVIAPTRAMRAALTAAHGRLRNARVIPNGLDVEAVLAAPPAHGSRILTAGRVWDPAKNVLALCEAAAGLAWPVYLAGDTRLSPSDPEPSLAPGVIALGRLPASAMRAWYGRCAIYVHPARYEPFGLAVLEAAAAGCALVLGEIPSLRENWEGAAVFVDPRDPAALRDALDSLIADDAARTRLGASARARARGFSCDAMTDAYLHAYAAAARRSPRAHQSLTVRAAAGSETDAGRELGAAGGAR